jgi:uncharacterized protein (DUF1501 family)
MRRPTFRHANRREFLAAGLLGTVGLALSPMMQTVLAREDKKRAKACILVWLNGGPSHLDTFDPKPAADAKIAGPFKALDTKVSGVQLSEHLPHLGEQAKHLAVIRSLTSKEADHDRAYFYLHTGNLRDETVEYPALGSVVAHKWKDTESDLPSFVALNGGAPGGGFLGLDFDPYVVGNLDAPLDNLNLPDGIDEDRLDRRLKALEVLNDRFGLKGDLAKVIEHKKVTDKALKLRKSPALKAFDLKDEKAETLRAYGIAESVPDGQAMPTFGKSCLLARRMIENGVRFVEVTLDGWDTHADNFTGVEALSKELDPALATLTADLADRGLLDQTLVLCMGEFGRTPTINQQNGRDHWSEAFSMLLAGGGVKGGQVIGASDEKGEHVKEKPVTIPDLYASVLTAFGINPSFTYHTPSGRPIKLAGKGSVVKELFS